MSTPAYIRRIITKRDAEKQNVAGVKKTYDAAQAAVKAAEDEVKRLTGLINTDQAELSIIPGKISDIDNKLVEMQNNFKAGIVAQLKNNELTIDGTFTPEMISDDSKIYLPIK